MATKTPETTRTTVALSEPLYAEVTQAAAQLRISVADYIRRSLAFQAKLDRYINEHGELIIFDPDREREIHLQLVT